MSDNESATASLASKGCTVPSDTASMKSFESVNLEGLPYFGSGMIDISPKIGIITCSVISKIAEELFPTSRNAFFIFFLQ